MTHKTCEKCGSTRLAIPADPMGWAVCQACNHSQWNGKDAGEIKPIDEAAPTIPPPPKKFDPKLEITRCGTAMFEQKLEHSVVPSVSMRINLHQILGYYYPDETEGNRTVLMAPNGANFFIYGDHREVLDAWHKTKKGGSC